MPEKIQTNLMVRIDKVKNTENTISSKKNKKKKTFENKSL